MEIIRTHNSYSLNKGDGMANGLFNISAESGALSLWFNDVEDLLSLDDNKFLIACQNKLDYSDILRNLFSEYTWDDKSDIGSYFGTKPEPIESVDNLTTLGRRVIFISGAFDQDPTFNYSIIYSAAKVLNKVEYEDEESGEIEIVESLDDHEYKKIFISGETMEIIIQKIKDLENGSI